MVRATEESVRVAIHMTRGTVRTRRTGRAAVQNMSRLDGADDDGADSIQFAPSVVRNNEHEADTRLLASRKPLYVQLDGGGGERDDVLG